MWECSFVKFLHSKSQFKNSCSMKIRKTISFWLLSNILWVIYFDYSEFFKQNISNVIKLITNIIENCNSDPLISSNWRIKTSSNLNHQLIILAFLHASTIDLIKWNRYLTKFWITIQLYYHETYTTSNMYEYTWIRFEYNNSQKNNTYFIKTLSALT